MSHLPNVYAIIDIADLGNVDFSQIGEDSESTVRISLDLTEVVIKWYDEHEPTFIADGTVVPIQTLTHSECLTLLATDEWTNNEPPLP